MLIAFAGRACALDAAAVAPLAESEFFEFFDAYHAFSTCIEDLARSKGLDGRAVGEILSKNDKVKGLIVDARAILMPNSPFRSQIESTSLSESQRAQIAMAALADQGRSSDLAINQTRHIVSLAMARMFVAQASDGSCGPSKEFMTLFDKARKQ